MREIKYRVWDTQEKKMYGWETCRQRYTLDWLDNWMLGMHVIMQFTGLYDKPGKEIWEGDIVALNTAKGVQVGVVIWWKEHGRWALDVQGRKYAAYFKANQKVIGNIYENPELLKI